jgi:hypothetical protein
METIKPLSKNVQISKFDRKFNSRDYTIRLNKLGRIFCMDFDRWVTAAVQPTEDSTVEINAHFKKDSEYMQRYDTDDFINVGFNNLSPSSFGDRISLQISVEQAAALRDQLNALDI